MSCLFLTPPLQKCQNKPSARAVTAGLFSRKMNFSNYGGKLNDFSNDLHTLTLSRSVFLTLFPLLKINLPRLSFPLDKT